MTVPNLEATVTLAPSDQWDFADTALLEATVAALRERHPVLASKPAALSFETTIPRQVGLSGSSAIIMAALRAFARRVDTEWDLVDLARTTLEVETEVLGWAAGPQDRVVQAYTGLVDMDFATPWDAAHYHRLDPHKLPPLFVAWDLAPGQPSDVAHSNIRQRWLDGDATVRATMARFAELAISGRASLDAGTAPQQWSALMDEAFQLRSRIWTITAADSKLITTGQRVGAGVTFAGSGGAVVGAATDHATLARAARAYEAAGAGFLILHPGDQS